MIKIKRECYIKLSGHENRKTYKNSKMAKEKYIKIIRWPKGN